MHARPHSAEVLDSRGLLYLRRGDYAKAIADYDAALSIKPKIAWSLYGRGVAELRGGDKAKGQADIADATALSAELPAKAKLYGVMP